MTYKTELIICLGTGGVGKTTLAGVIGLSEALAGKKTLIITLDPAQRLLEALASKKTSQDMIKIDIKPILGVKGQLFVLVPDVYKEWLDFLLSSINAQDRQEKILGNHFYQYMAEGMPGSLEIIGCHLLYRLREQNDFDVIILDTPPVSNSLSFFKVPQKITTLLDESIFKTIIKKRHHLWFKFTKDLIFFSGGIFHKTIEKLVGSHFFSEFMDFALTIDGLYAPMQQRCQYMQALWRDNHTKFTLILRPHSASVNDSMMLKANLSTMGIKINNIIINQICGTNNDTIDHEIGKLSMQQKKSLSTLITREKNIANIEQNLIYAIKYHFAPISCMMINKTYSHHRYELIKYLYQSYQQGK